MKILKFYDKIKDILLINKKIMWFYEGQMGNLNYLTEIQSKFSKSIKDYLKSIEGTKISNSSKNLIVLEAMTLDSDKFNVLYNYIRWFKDRESIQDNKLQIINLLSALLLARKENTTTIERLPETISLKIKWWEIYHNWNIFQDYRNFLKSYSLSNNLRNWLQQWETWTITINFGWKRRRVKISYEKSLIFIKYRNYDKISFILTKEPKIIHFWSNVPKRERWTKHWTFLEFQIQLDWFEEWHDHHWWHWKRRYRWRRKQ